MLTTDELRRVVVALTSITRNANSQRRHRLRNSAARVELSMPGMLILSHCCNEGSSRVSDMADVLDMPAPVVSREAKRLVEDGLLARSGSAHDGRVALFAPTASGRRAFRRYRDVSEEELARLLADWDDDDILRFAAFLEQFVADLRSKGDEVYAPRRRRRS